MPIHQLIQEVTLLCLKLALQQTPDTPSGTDGRMFLCIMGNTVLLVCPLLEAHAVSLASLWKNLMFFWHQPLPWLVLSALKWILLCVCVRRILDASTEALRLRRRT